MGDQPVTADVRLSALLEHYRDSFAHVREYIKGRNRLFAYTLAAVIALALRASDAAESERVLAIIAEKLLGAELHGGLLVGLLWFMLFAVATRYFQAAIHVNRQYEYVDRVETEISTIYGNDVFAREGAGYARNYPAYSRWMDIVYTWVFPGALLGVTVWNIVADIARSGMASVPGTSSLVLGLGIAGTVLAYVYSAKFERSAAE